jgi:hypothetical protein
MKMNELRKIVRIQSLVGVAKSNYENDRDPNRAENVTRPLREAFQLCLELTGNYPVIEGET